MKLKQRFWWWWKITRRLWFIRWRSRLIIWRCSLIIWWIRFTPRKAVRRAYIWTSSWFPAWHRWNMRRQERLRIKLLKQLGEL